MSLTVKLLIESFGKAIFMFIMSAIVTIGSAGASYGYQADVRITFLSLLFVSILQVVLKVQPSIQLWKASQNMVAVQFIATLFGILCGTVVFSYYFGNFLYGSMLIVISMMLAQYQETVTHMKHKTMLSGTEE